MGTTKYEAAVPAALELAGVAPAHCAISAVSFQGLTVTTADGRPAKLAVIDADGNVLDAGRDVENAAFKVAVEAYRNFLMGSGHLRVLAKPPGSGMPQI
ncbi:hypothetical protein [Cupriavidus alkaliphilus]|uniref:hypothetical protein n=1 Tax=Cupriavidus alkaliphilus TaxID=942866 RepID=UPI0016150B1B|nr:hypothetical protein [Cupriavidus alkaliphilus]MBB2918286.1 hypothetical protein [Cupriavidus alkaliphilus]